MLSFHRRRVRPFPQEVSDSAELSVHSDDSLNKNLGPLGRKLRKERRRQGGPPGSSPVPFALALGSPGRERKAAKKQRRKERKEAKERARREAEEKAKREAKEKAEREKERERERREKKELEASRRKALHAGRSDEDESDISDVRSVFAFSKATSTHPLPS